MNDKRFYRGNIFFARLEDKGGSIEFGHRPVLIVQNNKGNENGPTLICVPITSRIKKEWMPVHVLLQPSGDLRPSMVLCEQILTINKSDMGDYLTHLDDQAMSKVDDALAISVGLKKPNCHGALM